MSTAREPHAQEAPPTQLQDLTNVGPTIAARLRLIGVCTLANLAERDPYALFEELCTKTDERLDPCLLDVLISARRF